MQNHNVVTIDFRDKSPLKKLNEDRYANEFMRKLWHLGFQDIRFEKTYIGYSNDKDHFDYRISLAGFPRGRANTIKEAIDLAKTEIYKLGIIIE